MALEIERRFLVKNDNWKKYITKKTVIEQGYLSYKLDDWIIRIRFNGEDFKIALKKHIKNFTNFEFEYLIPNDDGAEIISSLKNTVKKERFFAKIEKNTWIIDCFKEHNFPLEIAEIELASEEEIIKLPSFISKEVTGIKNLTNFSLATYPFSKWTEEELRSLNHK